MAPPFCARGHTIGYETGLSSNGRTKLVAILWDQKNLAREWILHLCPRREAADVDQALIRRKGTFDEAWFAGNRGPVRIISLGLYRGRGRRGGRCSRFRRRRRRCSFRRRSVWIERLLGNGVLSFSRIFGDRVMSRPTRRRLLIIGACRHKQGCEQCERERKFHKIFFDEFTCVLIHCQRADNG
jgi:hypothetical protein